ncbi:DUF1223 domain-containing protein [Agaribacter flavus]|uniref:DUF1223 domain-containing protein n=1 Tax=Agaribacter flavus TaxID=1902781 RepID=A0ABV7FQE9_9ALTE
MIWINIAIAAEPTPKAQVSFVSSEKQVTLLELYSSQGCSSCPPAQHWVNALAQNPSLWEEIIPVVFHVDYWDYIGWQDPFGHAEYSQRQRAYRNSKAINSVYTPGFVVNGSEWTGWFAGHDLSLQGSEVGVLKTSLVNDKLHVSFDSDSSQNLTVNIAVLGFDLFTKVRRGENARKTLEDNFVVLAMKSQEFDNNGTYDLPDYSALKCRLAKKGTVIEKTALVVWLANADNASPVQAVGGYL